MSNGNEKPPQADNADTGGEKKPKKDTRFKPGYCPNPAGRPKGSIGWKGKLQRELNKKTTVVTKAGKSVQMLKGDVIIAQLADKAMRDFKAAVQVLTWIGDDASEPGKALAASGSIPKLDRETLRRILKRAERLEEDSSEEIEPIEDEDENDE
jgi:Family of unknown function (DUF5681)